jgi:NIPSNAP
MYYELRTYTIAPVKLADWLALYKREALPVQTECLGQLVGFFTTEFGALNQVVHIWAYTSLDDRAERRGKMMTDPRWQEFSRLNKELGAVMSLESRIMRPTDFSPLK